MNKPSPLIPQGSLPQGAGKGASNVRIAVVTIIAIHIVFFGGLLMQGCKRDNKKNDAALTDTNNMALTLPVMTNRETIPDTTPIPGSNDLSAGYQTPGSQSNAPSLPSTVTTTEPPSPLPSSSVIGGSGSEYTVVRNDTLSKIAHAHGITAGAIAKANPGLDPAKLKIGQKIQLPASSGPATSTTPGAVGDATAGISPTGTGSTTVHVVKAGDTLTRIAHQHGITVKALRSANGLKTDRVSVGQKLKIPAKSGATNASAASKTAVVARNTRGQ